LLVAPPRGGRPLNTPLELTNVKRDEEWDTGFVVVFKVRSYFRSMRDPGRLTSVEQRSAEGVRCRSRA
jgi:hypothetical protein